MIEMKTNSRHAQLKTGGMDVRLNKAGSAAWRFNKTTGGAIHELPQSNGRGGVTPPMGEDTSPLQKLTLGRIVNYKYQTKRKLAKPILLTIDLQEKIDYEYTRIEI